MEALEELNEVRKENAKFRDAIGSLEIELALPPMPSADDEIHIDLLPHTWGRGNLAQTGSVATVQTTWISAFPIFFNNLNWGNEYSFYINEEDSCVEIGSAIASEAKQVDTAKCFKITKGTLDRLSSFYIEAGLMNPVGADEAFTEAAKKVARRHSIIGRTEANFSVINGKIEVTSASSARADLEDDIPF